MDQSAGNTRLGIRYRPIFGGIFGKAGEYVLATMPAIERGLHSVRFMVLHPKTGGVLAVSGDKTEALAQARRLLKAAARLTCGNEPSFAQPSLWEDEQLPPAKPGAIAKQKRISRRRKEVYDRSQGKCHYCSTPLTLDGCWHVEHMLPQALSNLLNSSMIDVRQVGGKLIGIATYTADYAEAVHDPNHPQDFRRASARKEFLKQGFENAEPKMREILARTLKA